jgi:hypothetical protein
MVMLLVYLLSVRRRRLWWARWGPMPGPGRYPPMGPWPARGYRATWPDRGRTESGTRELAEQRSTVELLESRVAELEARLDFTERLLAGRQEAPPRA